MDATYFKLMFIYIFTFRVTGQSVIIHFVIIRYQGDHCPWPASCRTLCLRIYHPWENTAYRHLSHLGLNFGPDCYIVALDIRR